MEGRADHDVVLAARAARKEVLDLSAVKAGQPGHRCRQPAAQLGWRLRVPRVVGQLGPINEARVSRRVRGAHTAENAALGVVEAQRELRVEAGLARQRHCLPTLGADLWAKRGSDGRMAGHMAVARPSPRLADASHRGAPLLICHSTATQGAL